MITGFEMCNMFASDSECLKQINACVSLKLHICKRFPCLWGFNSHLVTGGYILGSTFNLVCFVHCYSIQLQKTHFWLVLGFMLVWNLNLDLKALKQPSHGLTSMWCKEWTFSNVSSCTRNNSYRINSMFQYITRQPPRLLLDPFVKLVKYAALASLRSKT